MQLVRPQAGRIGRRLRAALSLLENPLLEVEAGNRLVADNGDDPIECRVLRDWPGSRLLRRHRPGQGRESKDEQ